MCDWGYAMVSSSEQKQRVLCVTAAAKDNLIPYVYAVSDLPELVIFRQLCRHRRDIIVTHDDVWTITHRQERWLTVRGEDHAGRVCTVGLNWMTL